MFSLLRTLDDRRRRARNARRGTALIETALILPVCLLFIFGIMEYGRYLMMVHLINNATREGARYAVSHTQPVIIDGVTYGNATSDVTNVVNRFMMNHKLVNQTTSVYRSDANGNNIGAWTTADSGDSICVQIAGQFQWITPRLLRLPATTPLQVRSVMRSESN